MFYKHLRLLVTILWLALIGPHFYVVHKAESNILARDHKLKRGALASKNNGLLHIKQLNKVCLKGVNYHILIFNLTDRFGGQLSSKSFNIIKCFTSETTLA